MLRCSLCSMKQCSVTDDVVVLLSYAALVQMNHDKHLTAIHSVLLKCVGSFV